MLTSGHIKYRDGYKYQLAEDWWCVTPITGNACAIDDPDVPGKPWIRLADNGTLMIRGGYAWDGPSGPTIDTDDFMRGALAHDALYQLMRARKLAPECRASADGVLAELCAQDGMSWFRRWYVYRAVRKFAGFAAAPDDSPPRVAP